MKKFLSLISIVALMVVFAMPAMAGGWGWGWGNSPDYNVHVDGQAYRQSTFETNGNRNYAGGSNNSYGYYNGNGTDGIWGTAGANGTVIADKARGENWRAAGAISRSSSGAEMGGAKGPLCGLFSSGSGDVSVSGFGDAYHRTNLRGGTGGWTTGYAAYTYEGSDHGNIGNVFGYQSYGPDISGSGLAATGGAVWRTSTPNSASSHAYSGSYAVSSGGGILTTN